MSKQVDYDDLDEALARCGASWNAAQAHGLLCARLSVDGDTSVPAVIGQILEGNDANDAQRKEAAELLAAIAAAARESFRERMSGFAPLLPDDAQSAEIRTRALADWSEAYLHGLVSGDGTRSEPLRARLAAEPLADIVRDLLQFTRASVDPESATEENEASYAELVEYLRVAGQLVYEELAEVRPGVPDGA
jgi:uncharacterized protein YgfB (UPF0149 family)